MLGLWLGLGFGVLIRYVGFVVGFALGGYCVNVVYSFGLGTIGLLDC